MELLVILAILLLLFAVFGGIYLSPLLWFVVIIAVLVALFSYRGRTRL
jgi:uncharacterized membrane protein